MKLSQGEPRISMMSKIDVYLAQQGFPCYRIPGIICTAKGTLIVYCETRASGDDWEAHGISMRRSPDGGRTWEAPVELVASRPETLSNPVMIACQDGAVHFLWEAGYHDLYHQVSLDDGLNFSLPRRLEVLEAFRPEYDWNVSAIGPGHGIETRDGLLVIPVWLACAEGRKHYPSVVSAISSADGGKTWRRGDIVYSLMDNSFESPNETTVAELDDGTLYFNFRHRGDQRVRYTAFSRDGLHFTTPRPDGSLPDPRCFGACASQGKRLLFVNCATSGMMRMWLTVQQSMDGGASWNAAKLIELGEAGYADVAISPDGKAWVFYERGNWQGDHDIPRALTVAGFDLAELENPAQLKAEMTQAARCYAVQALQSANIQLSPAEWGRIGVTDFGLGLLSLCGAQWFAYSDTPGVFRELVLLPGQTCPQHRSSQPRTLRCRAGKLYLYVPGQAKATPGVHPPVNDSACYTAEHELVLEPGDQCTLAPGTPHWFRGGPQGAVASEFSAENDDPVFDHPQAVPVPNL